MFKEVFFETNWIRIKNMIGKYLSFSNITSCSFWIFVWHLKDSQWYHQKIRKKYCITHQLRAVFMLKSKIKQVHV